MKQKLMFIFLITFYSCKKENILNPSPVNPLVKCKVTYLNMYLSFGNYGVKNIVVDSFYYDTNNRLSKVISDSVNNNNDKITQYTYYKDSVVLEEVYTNSTLNTQIVYILNEVGLAKEKHIYNSTGITKSKLVYNADNFLTSESSIPNSENIASYNLNNNNYSLVITENYIYNNTFNNNIPNTLGYQNYGVNFLGKSSQNVVILEQRRNNINNSLFEHFTSFTYQLDDKNRIENILVVVDKNSYNLLNRYYQNIYYYE